MFRTLKLNLSGEGKCEMAVTARNIFLKIIKSKITVLLAILFVWFSGSQMKAAADYSASITYQQYLLGAQSEEVTEDSEEKELEAGISLGSLGSGGVSGEFSYDEIVNSVKGDNKDEARQFASTMATYSTFNYFTNKVEGFSSIIPYVGRVLSLLVLLPLAILMDILHLVIPTILKAIAKINVVRLLADKVTTLSVTSELADMIGVSDETFSTFTTILFSLSIISILLALGGMFRPGGRIDERNYSKLKGRLFSIIALPLIVGIGAHFIDDLIDLTSNNDSAPGSFSRYLVDDRAWAYNFNFAPNGEDGKDGDIDPTSDNSYVDLKYNPYTGDGKDRIKQINSKSSLAKSGGDDDNIFPNTAMTISYGMSESFSAIDFINYKGTKASQSFYGRDDGDGEAFGSYYAYANAMEEELTDVDKTYNPSGSEKDDESPDGGYVESIDDYAEDDELIETPQIAWRDRFIYGAKNSGDNIDAYYGEAPSIEQMDNQVGKHEEQAFSNQSMFLILSTMFNETGGKYSLDAPARGVMQAKAAFDSNRSSYYVVSMVGNSFFTMFGLIARPIIQLVVMLATITAILSMGVIEMNSKPLMAWIKGMTLGDMEYARALIVYCVGIAGTILSLIVIPSMIAGTVEAVGKMVVLPAYFLDRDALSPQASLALHGTPLIFSSMVSLFFGFLYFKSPGFRSNLIELMTMPWAWAKSTGERMEFQASGGQGMRAKQENKRLAERSKFNQTVGKSDQSTSRFGAMKNWMSSAKDDVKRDFNGSGLNPTKRSQSTGQPGGENMQSGGKNAQFGNKGKPQSAQKIARNGMYERSMNHLKATESDANMPGNVQVASIDAQEGIMNFRKKPTEENYTNAHDKMDLLEGEMEGGNYSEEQKGRVSGARNELYNLGNSHNLKGGRGGKKSGLPGGQEAKPQDDSQSPQMAAESTSGYTAGSGGSKDKRNPQSPENQNTGTAKRQGDSGVKTGSAKQGRRKGDARDRAENAAIGKVTKVNGGTLKEGEARYEQKFKNDPLHRNLRKGAGTDWENIGYGNDKQSEEDAIRDELGEDAVKRHRAGEDVSDEWNDEYD